MADAESLTAEDLRGRLYHSMREKGLVDALKSQLRNKLVTELKHMGVKETLPASEPVYDKDGSLLHKAANSVVADHLRRCNYDYTLSVYLPETGMTHDKIFTTKDLLQLLNISPQSRLYKNLVAQSAYPKKGFLWQIICELASLHGLSCRDVGAQTDPTSLPPITSLEEQFRELDSHYSNMGDFLKNKMFVEERILNYQHQLDERSKTEVQLEVARFKENELSRMRMEEREAHRQELDKLRKEMDRTYRSKISALSERERHALESQQKMQEMQEKETYNQRQQILAEIEVIRGKEVAMRRQQEIDQREKTLWEEKFKSKDELVKRREEIVRTKELEYEQKVNEAIRKFKLEEQARTMEKFNEMEVRQARIKDDERRLYDELHGLHAIKDELKEKRARVNELEADMIQVRHQAIKAEKDNELLSERIRGMADYPMLKEDHNVSRREIEGLKERISELTRDNMVVRQKQEELLREMSERAGKPTPELYFLQQQMEKVQNELRQERALADHQRRQGDTRLQEEIDRNKDLLRKFEEQSLQQKEMGQELHDVRDHLADTTQALTNEVYRKPHDALPARTDSPCDLDSETALQPPGPVDPGMIHTHANPANLFSARAQATDYFANGGTADSDDYSYSFDLVRETKDRLKNLEREAEMLERNYQNFQTRMTTVSVYPALDEPPLTPHMASPQRNPQRVPMYSASPQTDVHVSPNRSRVTFQDNLNDSTIAGSRNVTGVGVTPSRLGERPISSTPSKPSSTRTPGALASQDMMDSSVSTVRSSPERQYYDNREEVRKRPLSVGDLDPPRPGSPNVVILQNSYTSGSLSHGGGVSQPPQHQQRVSPSGEEGGLSDAAAPTISLDDAWKAPAPAQPVSLDNAWQSQQQQKEDDDRRRREEEDEERRRQEEEDRLYEERKRQREEERRRKEEEARERERQALLELENKASTSSKPTAAAKEEKKEEVKEATKEEEKEEEKDEGDGIDPVMKKYMEMVAQQREKERKVVENTVKTWKKGHKEYTPEASDIDLSIADEEKEQSFMSAGKGSDEDFW